MTFTIDKREEIDSTNLEVIRRAKTGAPEGTLVQAERQISGRGRRGRAWESPAGSNLYMTLLLRPDVTMEQASVLTLIMALACQEGIKEATGLDCQIKWPNDLVLHKKKVVGILTEAAMLEQDEAFPEGETQKEHPYALACGVGINVNQKKFPEEIADKATSLFIESGRHWKRDEEKHTEERPEDVRDAVRDDILRAFAVRYEQFLQTADLSLMKADYISHLINLDQPVRVLDPKGEFGGVALGIDNHGQLLVKTKENGIVPVYAGEVSVRGLYEYV